MTAGCKPFKFVPKKPKAASAGKCACFTQDVRCPKIGRQVWVATNKWTNIPTGKYGHFLANPWGVNFENQSPDTGPYHLGPHSWTNRSAIRGLGLPPLPTTTVPLLSHRLPNGEKVGPTSPHRHARKLFHMGLGQDAGTSPRLLKCILLIAPRG